MPTRGQFSRAKAHVAKGHEAEKTRLRARARVVPVVGPAVAGHVADKRLELSQRRGARGQYSKLAVMSAITEAARNTRSQMRSMKRPLVKPVQHKPQVVKTPAPAPPAIAPPTQTPTQMTPIAKLGALGAMKKAKKAVDDMGQTRRTWRGGPPKKPVPGPENNPVPESWRGHDF